MQTKLLFEFLPISSEPKDREQKDEEQRKIDMKAEEDAYDINWDYELQKEFKDRISILTIGYHNLAVEQEHL